jgi:integrase
MTTSPPSRSAAALAKAEAYRQRADADATVVAYSRDVERYRTWCAENGFPAFPAAPETVGAYISAKGPDFAHNTLVRWIAGIAWQARREGAPLDTKHTAIRDALRGINRVRKEGQKGRRAAAITTEEIRPLVDSCSKDLAGFRDRALLLVGFAGALRRSELAGLDVDHVRWTKSGLVLTIGRAKSDQEGQGAEIAIVHGRHSETCPVRALQTWLARAKITEGALFRKVARGGHVQRDRLSGGGVWQIVTRRCRAIGMKAPSGEYLSPHSLRAGFVTTAYANQVPDEEIMDQTRHKSLTTMRGYVRRAKLRGGGASGKVGL